MSYLNALRLHFSGQFQANVSTVNNDPGHFDNAVFEPSYQLMQSGNDANGWFNPQGDAAFRLRGCTVTSAFMGPGAVPATDPILGYLVADSDGAVPGKLVDLDSEQQLVSQIWGLQVRIATAQGDTLMRGNFLPAAFNDIWNRATGQGSGSDIGAGAAYQSVLLDLEWGDVSASPFLSALQQEAAATGALSIKFNVDGLSMDFTSADFMCGRIAGTIGPYLAGEPQHLVVGRQFMPVGVQAPGNFFIPGGGINFFPAVVDAGGGTIYLDLGNALSTDDPGGTMNPLGDLMLSAVDPIATPSAPAGSTTPLGTIPATGSSGYASDPGWYARTAGVVALPVDAALLELAQVQSLVLTGNRGTNVAEWDNGAFVRADGFVFRVSPDETVEIPVYAMQFGRPLANVEVGFVLDPSQLQPSNSIGGAPPVVGTPETALSFAETAPTNAQGVAVLKLNTTDPGTPRWFNNGADYGIDGQVYGIRPAFADASLNAGPVNDTNFISILLWSGYTPSNPVTWTDIQPIMQQYANLYPVMLRFLNLADYDSVKANAWLLSLAFGLDPADPNAMPVTRDLSPAKRKAILAWLQDPLPGTAPAPTAPVAAKLNAAPFARPDPAAMAELIAKGGKAAAMSRRLVVQAR